MGAIGKREKNKRKERYCIDSYSSAKEDRVLREAQHAKKKFFASGTFFPGKYIFRPMSSTIQKINIARSIINKQKQKR